MDEPCAARRGPGPWAALVWLPLLLIGPLTSMPAGGRAVGAWLAVVAVAALQVAAVTGAHGRPPAAPARSEALLAGQALVTAGAIAAYGSGWATLVGLLSIGVGAAVRPRIAPFAVAGLALVCLAVVLVGGGEWDDAWPTVLTAFLSGFTTFLFYRLYAVIAELQRTREELARVAVEEERLRFGRDLHDLLGHTLSLVVVKAEAVRRLVDRDPAAARQHATDIEQIGRDALVEVRQAVAGYRGAGLADELDRARSALAAAGVTADVSTAPALPDDVDAVLGWVVREGVTNVLKHARAAHCQVTVRREGDHVWALVEDDGGRRTGTGTAATPTASTGAQGAGLVGLAERVAIAGGRLHITAGGHGFSVRAEIPLPVLPVPERPAALGALPEPDERAPDEHASDEHGSAPARRARAFAEPQ